MDILNQFDPEYLISMRSLLNEWFYENFPKDNGYISPLWDPELHKHREKIQQIAVPQFSPYVYFWEHRRVHELSQHFSLLLASKPPTLIYKGETYVFKVIVFHLTSDLIRIFIDDYYIANLVPTEDTILSCVKDIKYPVKEFFFLLHNYLCPETNTMRMESIKSSLLLINEPFEGASSYKLRNKPIVSNACTKKIGNRPGLYTTGLWALELLYDLQAMPSVFCYISFLSPEKTEEIFSTLYISPTFYSTPVRVFKATAGIVMKVFTKKGSSQTFLAAMIFFPIIDMAIPLTDKGQIPPLYHLFFGYYQILSVMKKQNGSSEELNKLVKLTSVIISQHFNKPEKIVNIHSYINPGRYAFSRRTRQVISHEIQKKQEWYDTEDSLMVAIETWDPEEGDNEEVSELLKATELFKYIEEIKIDSQLKEQPVDAEGGAGLISPTIITDAYGN